MAYSIRLLIDGETAKSDSEGGRAVRVWQVDDGDDRTGDEICALVLAEAPLSLGGRTKRSAAAKRESYTIWNVTLTYEPGTSESEEENNKAPGTSVYAFEIGGKTETIYQSLQTWRGPEESPPPNHYGAINVDGKGNVKGVDVYVPSYAFSETHQIAPQLITPGYKYDIFSLAGKVNENGFKGFQAGEVLFIGASGQTKDLTRWEITYRFLASPNVFQVVTVRRPNPSVGGGMVDVMFAIQKDGWDYLWYAYGTEADTTAKGLARRPIGCYVERVYERGDMSKLNIGV